VQLGLVEDYPATGATAASVEGIAQYHAEDRRSGRVWTSWTRLGAELPVENFGDEVRGHRQQIAVARTARGGLNHTQSLTEIERAQRTQSVALTPPWRLPVACSAIRTMVRLPHAQDGLWAARAECQRGDAFVGSAR
jgi:hypothetical protein